jgi:hypothetical protein
MGNIWAKEARENKSPRLLKNYVYKTNAKMTMFSCWEGITADGYFLPK